MILKSFWRKKTTKIYLIMLTSLFLTIIAYLLPENM